MPRYEARQEWNGDWLVVDRETGWRSARYLGRYLTSKGAAMRFAAMLNEREP